jgi:hypothetical protein
LGNHLKEESVERLLTNLNPLKPSIMKKKLLFIIWAFVSGMAYGQASKADEEALLKATFSHPEVAAIIERTFPDDIVLLENAFPFSEGLAVQANGKNLVFRTKNEVNASGGASLIFWRLHIVENNAFVNFILQQGEALGFAIKLSKAGENWQVAEVLVEGGER